MEIHQLTMPARELESGVGFVHQRSVRETYPKHTHTFFEFFYILKGKAIHHINGQQLVLDEGTLVFIRPKDIHQYAFFNQFDMELVSLGVPPAQVEEICALLKLDMKIFTSPELPPQLSLIGDAHWQVSRQLLQVGKMPEGLERWRYFRSLLPGLLYQIAYVKNQTTPIPAWLAHLVDLMSLPEHFVQGLPHMVQLSRVTQEHLNRSCRKYLGLSPTAFINLRRIHYSAELLESGSDILDACYQSGFNHVSYFYRVFQNILHCTPGEFISKRNHSDSDSFACLPF